MGLSVTPPSRRWRGVPPLGVVGAGPVKRSLALPGDEGADGCTTGEVRAGVDLASGNGYELSKWLSLWAY